MAFNKEQYWANKPNNIGSKRPKTNVTQNFETIVGTTLKKLSKYAIRKNTKRARKAAL